MLEKTNNQDTINLYLTRLDYDKQIVKQGVCLGKWCLSSEDITKPQSINHKVLPYVFEDKNKYPDANTEVSRAYDKLILVLGEKLNMIHGRNFSDRFWKVTVGYWFRQYLDNLYERYHVLMHAADCFPQAHVQLIPEHSEWVAADTDEFSVGLFSDRLNHQIFGQIIRARNLFKFSDVLELSPVERSVVGRKKRNKLFEIVRHILSLSCCYCGRYNKIVMQSTYFSWKLLFILCFRFLSFPFIALPKLNFKDWRVNLSLRDRFENKNIQNLSDFEQLAVELLPRNVPGIFLEKFQDLLDMSEKFRPKKAKIFLTANAFASNEIYKIWAGTALEYRTGKHVIIQHGANYGHSEIMSEEQFEVDSSSDYLTSGWEDTRQANIKPFICSSFLGGIGGFKKNCPSINESGDIVWVLCSMPRYHYTQWSAPQGPLFYSYLSNQSQFINSLNKASKSRIICRSYHYDYGWNDLNYLKKTSFEFRVDQVRKPLRQIIKKAYLMVFTYDSTSMMESMALNVPTICYWDQEQWPWRKGAASLLSGLESVGIFHKNEESAARFINDHLELGTLDQWWSSLQVQKVREMYCSEYANTYEKEYRVWVSQIRKWLDRGHCNNATGIQPN